MRAMLSLATIVASAGLFYPGCGDDQDDSTALAFRDYTDGTTGGAHHGTGEPGPQSGSTGGFIDDTCSAYTEWAVTCHPSPASALEIAAQCEQGRVDVEAMLGPACRILYDAWVVCHWDWGCTDQPVCSTEAQAFADCMPPISELCAAEGARRAECGRGTAEEEAKKCQTVLNYRHHMSQACGTATEHFIACDRTHACVDLGKVAGCEAAAAELSQACV